MNCRFELEIWDSEIRSGDCCCELGIKDFFDLVYAFFNFRYFFEIWWHTFHDVQFIFERGLWSGEAKSCIRIVWYILPPSFFFLHTHICFSMERTSNPLFPIFVLLPGSFKLQLLQQSTHSTLFRSVGSLRGSTEFLKSSGPNFYEYFIKEKLLIFIKESFFVKVWVFAPICPKTHTLGHRAFIL